MGTITLSLPQTGLPNSTEDVKITNDLTLIQNVINGNLDASNLSTTSGIMKLGVTVPGSNYAANYGDLVNAAPGITVTLPTPRSNALVGVVAQGGTTGANPVTVAGTNIYGVGLTAASSFKLGVPIAAVVLQSDGTNWIVVSGQQDTGWVALSLGANVTGGFTTGSDSLVYPAPSARVRGDQLSLRGGIATTATITYPAALATLAAGMRPATNAVVATEATVPGIAPALVIRTTGVISALNSTVSSGTDCWFDGVTIPLT